MRITEPHVQVENYIPDIGKELVCPIGHPLRAPAASFDRHHIVCPRIRRFRLNVHLADDARCVSFTRQGLHNGRRVVAGMEIVDAVTVCMTVVIGQDIRPAGNAGRRRAERIRKPCRSFGQSIHDRGLYDRTAVALGERTPVIRNQ